MELVSLHDNIRAKLLGVDCVLAFETASDYLSTNKMTNQRPMYYVYATHELNIQGVECIILDNFDDLDIVNERRLYEISIELCNRNKTYQ